MPSMRPEPIDLGLPTAHPLVDPTAHKVSELENRVDKLEAELTRITLRLARHEELISGIPQTA